MMWNWSGMHGWYGFGGFGMVLVALALLAVLVLLLRAAWAYPPRDGASHRHEGPLDVLKRRYARGEIDRAEFEEKRRELS